MADRGTTTAPQGQAAEALAEASATLWDAAKHAGAVLAIFETLDLMDLVSDKDGPKNGFELIAAAELCLTRIRDSATKAYDDIGALLAASSAVTPAPAGLGGSHA